MQLLFNHDATVLQWANQFFESPLKASWVIGIIDNGGVLRGALIGEECNEHTAEVTICSNDKAITPDIAKTFFAAFFSRYWRLQVRTTKDNKTIKRNAPKWGLTYEQTAKDYWGPGRSALCYRMTKADCRWIRRTNEGNYGIEAEEHAAG